MKKRSCTGKLIQSCSSSFRHSLILRIGCILMIFLVSINIYSFRKHPRSLKQFQKVIKGIPALQSSPFPLRKLLTHISKLLISLLPVCIFRKQISQIPGILLLHLFSCPNLLFHKHTLLLSDSIFIYNKSPITCIVTGDLSSFVLFVTIQTPPHIFALVVLTDSSSVLRTKTAHIWGGNSIRVPI